MILLNPKDRRPLYEQITETLAELMLKGVMSPGDSLPSVRNLAAELSINPNTVQRAYIELERLGYIYTAVGKGSVVADISAISENKNREMTRRLDALLKEMKSAGFSKTEIEVRVDKTFDNKKGRA